MFKHFLGEQLVSKKNAETAECLVDENQVYLVFFLFLCLFCLGGVKICKNSKNARDLCVIAGYDEGILSVEKHELQHFEVLRQVNFCPHV